VRLHEQGAVLGMQTPSPRPYSLRSPQPHVTPPCNPLPQASPLQCVPLADSCLALGAAACRGAVAAIGELIEGQELGPKASGGRVIYAQVPAGARGQH
jgi:hypothetical protein